MINLSINDKEYNFPTSFDELTLEHYCNIFFKLPQIDESEDKQKQLVKIQSIVVSRILKENDEFALDLPIDIYIKLLEASQFIYDIEQFKTKAKNSIKIEGKEYHMLPMEKFSTRRFIDADTVSKDEENKNKYCEVLSIVLVENDDDKYDGNYKQLYNKVKNVPCSEGLPIVFFSFLRNEELKATIQTYSEIDKLNEFLVKITNSFQKNTHGL